MTRIGGPGTWLPRPVEAVLAWALAITCLTVSGYHYFVSTILSRIQRKDKDTSRWLPLTTASRAELDRKTPIQRYQQLVTLLQRITKESEWSDETLVSLLRENQVARRLASLAMRPPKNESSCPRHTPLGQQLVKLWPTLLPLPPLQSIDGSKFDISLIIPVYKESPSHLQTTLNRASNACRHPQKVQVLVVDAGLELQKKDLRGAAWGELRIVQFTHGGGRGPCLNYGASKATGRIYTFLHSDTTLPPKWDESIRQTLDNANDRANSCAFSFGIDTSSSQSCPPGIKAVEVTANWRTHLYSLPYGDQALSVPAIVFDYIGGFPDQCLMEDYELIFLLRKRSALLQSERLAIIGGRPALCSPRRWQRFGVLYVTFMNSKFVNLYASGLNPADLYRLYYGKPPPERSSPLAPWEKELEALLSS